MKKYYFFIFTGLLINATITSCSNANKEASEPSATAISPDSLVKRGEYLVSTIGCNDCHSPKVFGPQGPSPDPERLLMGHPADMAIGPVDTAALASWALFNAHFTAAVGPWGVSYAANLTSDPTGIGNWTKEQFYKAMREGKFKGLDGGRPLLPPMPWPNFRNLNDADLDAIFAYLKSTKPIQNVVPAPRPLSELTASK